jgi:REP-associated tyrosine transposase
VTRPPRDTAAGRFHVYTHCVWAVPALYRDDIDRLTFLRRLAYVTAVSGWRCMEYCLMTSHYHLLVEVGDGTLPKAMHALNLPYARSFNGRYALRGHVQFNRYGSRRIEDDEDLVGTFAYVANNPVRAGICSRASEWPWSSFPGTVGLTTPSPFIDPVPVLRCFPWPEPDASAALRRRVEES